MCVVRGWLLWWTVPAYMAGMLAYRPILGSETQAAAGAGASAGTDTSDQRSVLLTLTGGSSFHKSFTKTADNVHLPVFNWCGVTMTTLSALGDQIYAPETDGCDGGPARIVFVLFREVRLPAENAGSARKP